MVVTLCVLFALFTDDIRNADGFGYLALSMLGYSTLMGGVVGILVTGFFMVLFKTRRMKHIVSYAMGGSFGIFLFGVFLFLYV